MTAIWTQPRTWSVGELTTAALMNQHLRDNLDFLKGPPESSVDVGASVVLNSTSYADILTAPAISLSANNVRILVGFYGFASCSAAILASNLVFDITEDGTSILGGNGLQLSSIGSGGFFNVSHVVKSVRATGGAHTYKLRGKISVGTATIYGSAAGFFGRFFVQELGQ